MESLALFVALLLALVIFTGPISMLLTSKFLWNYSIQSKPFWIFRRILVSTISPVGVAMAIFFMFMPIPLGTKSVAAFGLAINVFALKREYFRK
jgi:uncharacterized membrane-anchored protein